MYVRESISAGMPGLLSGRNKKRGGNPKVNEFDESISSMPDFHVNEGLRAGGLFITRRPLGAFIIPPFDS